MRHLIQTLGIAFILFGCQTVQPTPTDRLTERHADLEARLDALDMSDPNLRFSEVERALRVDGFDETDFKRLADLDNSNAQVLYGRQFRFKDDSKSQLYYERACEAGNMFGCRAMGFSLNTSLNQDEMFFKGDYEASRPYFEKACEAGNALSCRALGNLYHYGRGVEKDIEKARMLYAKSCDIGNYFGCNDLGVLYMDGRGVTKDLKRAETLFQYACPGAGLACANLQIVERRMKRAGH